MSCILVLCFFSSATYANSDWQYERDIYKKARNALAKKQINQFQEYLSRLSQYPLYPYLKYEEMRLRVSNLSNSEVDAFLAENTDGPLANRMRATWLAQLQRKDQAESFLKYYQNERAASLQCYFLRAKIRSNQFEENKKKYLKQIRDLWLVNKSQPNQCDALFEWYEDQGYLTNELIWDRFSLAMEKSRLRLAKYLLKKLPSEEQKQAKLWLDAHAKPKKVLREKALQKDSHLNRKIVRHGLMRLARKDLTEAYYFWQDIQDNYAFSSDLHDEIDKNLALRAAYRHDERAAPWMNQLPKDLSDPAASHWRVRSAIRSQDWEMLLRGVAMLPKEEGVKPEWQYWKARALSKKGLRSDAQEIYEKIATERSYYGFMAADKISMPYSIVDEPVQYNVQELEEIELTPGIIRARELLLVDQLSDARREWNHATQNYTAQQYLTAASLAHQWGWHDYAIRTIAKGRYFDDLAIRFPTPFAVQVNKYSSKRNLEPAFVYGIIRRESAFNEQARSPVGARGLMQLMPATAKQVAKQLKVKAPTRQDLYTPGFNISLGSKYIGDMLNKFGGHRALASAAYNAGPHRVKAWLPEYDELPADVWVDTIPFTETREYVRAILAYTALFEWKLNQQQAPTRLSVHMQPVLP